MQISWFSGILHGLFMQVVPNFVGLNFDEIVLVFIFNWSFILGKADHFGPYIFLHLYLSYLLSYSVYHRIIVCKELTRRVI